MGSKQGCAFLFVPFYTVKSLKMKIQPCASNTKSSSFMKHWYKGKSVTSQNYQVLRTGPELYPSSPHFPWHPAGQPWDKHLLNKCSPFTLGPHQLALRRANSVPATNLHSEFIFKRSRRPTRDGQLKTLPEPPPFFPIFEL